MLSKLYNYLPGWTILDRLYFANGTFYVVTDNPESIPDRNYMISTGVFIENGPEAEARRTPGDKEMRVVDTDTARRLFGTQAERLDGVSVSINFVVLPTHILILRSSL